MTIGDKIRICRTDIGMSQDVLAKLMNYKDRTAISRIETGENKVTTEKAIEFARVLGVPLSELIDCSNEEHTASVMLNVYNDDILKEIITIMNDMSDNQKLDILKYVKYTRENG